MSGHEAYPLKILVSCFLFSTSLSQATKIQFFVGLGQSFNQPKILTNATNQMTKNTSSVNASGGYYYNQEQLGNYEGTIKNITNIYAGAESTLDNLGVFTIRGFLHAGYSNNVGFGNLHNVRQGNLRACNTAAGELPSLTNICYRDRFPTSQPNTTITFNDNPGFSNTIASNALMLSYGVGADVGINIPIHFIIEKTAGYKIIALRPGVYIGGGYEFISYSIGTYDNRTYNNTGTALIKENDTFYASGGGWFFHCGFNFYIGEHLRLDIGAKWDTTERESAKWYLQNSTQNGQENNIFAQQLLIQSHSIRMSSLWHVNVHVLF
ncbi:hypothetical protein CQA66_05905 [Helicobacter aurati]|uniref:Outer membrane beta-barrel protein n=1 Tax=Helicobacter aurati TaxID=137778 RepID=A0A3D8J3E8_9HELI|nr:hypothetical protein CQA66_05905 [Helicobacter aurati]